MHKFLENYKPSYGVFSSALGGETSDKVETAAFVDMRYYDGVAAYVHASGLASGSVITLTLLEGTSNAGASSATLTGKTDTFTATATTQKDVLQAEVRAEELSSGYRYVGFRLATNNSGAATEKVGGILLQGRARYGSSSLP
ncbi:hypothetical protein AMJ44_13995 [candidate division WOR-1 bacterium DG_54_3]|uniref:Uncharacterized protein n=1 Tax=candidate division WOR-1 bacterium DG_54_3 TaxID=1703775 RepID=A0A0S7XMY9_UNCSA|nr:MAG: hypothetical protein AMJ44_13995 [candidate division WOR-1 bacterium DG_54_3]